QETILFLCNTFNRQPEDFELFGRLEYGLNIDVSPLAPIDDIIGHYVNHESTNINPFCMFPEKKGKIIGGSSYHTDYRTKFYNKTRQSDAA
ncbi:MAG: hypothetical protein JKY09_06760, partial [Crocinitomicaceae bacterium]|nr:hypothetical protein [Crocinitomicaceae bacterium]